MLGTLFATCETLVLETLIWAKFNIIFAPPRGLTLRDSSPNGFKNSSPPSENVQILSASSAKIPMFQEQYKPKYEETPVHEQIKKTLVHKKYF